MLVPSLTESDVLRLIPNAAISGDPVCGGQKKVFPIAIGGTRYAAKFILCDRAADGEEEPSNLRALREIEILSKCDSQHLVKLGGAPPAHYLVNGEPLYFYCEEWIDGWDVRYLIKNQDQSAIRQLKLFASHMSRAIEELWSHSYVHRDIKPENVVVRNKKEEFVLLDLGLAFDVRGDSLSDPGTIPGTLLYFSPEQLNPSQKRNMDFRSDLFSTGVVLYEIATKVHPFRPNIVSYFEMAQMLNSHRPERPSFYRPDLPEEFDKLVMRLIAKEPHGRYRAFAHMRQDINAIPEV